MRDSQQCSRMSWQRDDAWLEARRQADFRREMEQGATNTIAPGCCPAIVEFYRVNRAGAQTTANSTIHTRCCINRMDSHELPAMKPQGGLSYHQFAERLSRQHAHPSLLMVSESIGQQQFLSLLCKAWSEGFEVSIDPGNFSTHFANISGRQHTHDGHQQEGSQAAGSSVLPTLSIRFARFLNEPTISELKSAVSAGKETHILLAGWYERQVSHGWSVRRILSYANVMMNVTRQLRPDASLTITGGPARHFPGGKWQVSGRYPKVKSNWSTSACDDVVSATDAVESEPIGLAWFDRNLTATAEVYNATFADFAGLDRDAGIFHVGYGLDMLGGKLKGAYKGGRDCLHWCIVPSISDLWARGIFAALAGCAG